MKLLSNTTGLSINWWYNGSASPWQNPTVTYTGSSQNFQGTSYFVHNLDFTSPKVWNGPIAGVVQPAADFHTGATFAGSPTVIVFDVQLFSGTTLLPLAPRLAGYDTGDVDLVSGGFVVNFFNTNPAAGRLVLSEVRVFRSPRMIDIAAMMRNAEPVDIQGVPVELISSARFENLELIDRVSLPLGNLTDQRTVDIIYGADECPAGSVGSSLAGSAGDGESAEVQYCQQGNALSLFPSTYTYLIATVVEPEARHWDPEREEFVVSPIQNIIYYQLGGILPDFNENGIDDLIDIRTGTSMDEDQNGVPDEVGAETGSEAGTGR
ncbi:MAG TPA: hypothetical protein VF756_21105 [Thermoanaerobaculia bacterium]